jgi:alcohol dehydrogenase (cytochrome c)
MKKLTLSFLTVALWVSAQQPPSRTTVRLAGGRTLEGIILNESPFNMQLRTAEGRIHLLVRDGENWREPTILPKQDWSSYDGDTRGNRYSPLQQINAGNVNRLAPRWIFPVPGAPQLQGTPIVVDGIMYVTASNEAFGLDAATGRRLWRYQQERTPGLFGGAARGANRGAAIRGDLIFMVTDHAHLIAINRWTGAKVWDTEMGDYQKDRYSATVAPMVIGDLVISGTSGGEEGARGFLAGYYASTGERAWRFWTIPAPGEKLAETWIGTALEHGCGTTWLTGSYDPELDLLYWGTGNPCPDYNGDDRKGDNLYTSSVIALRPKTGELRWYYQFTPHDTHDWDADQPLLLVDESWQGRPRKLLLQGSRNGFFYVLDRTNGEFLLGKQYLEKLTWATGIGKDGRPILVPNQEPSLEGTVTCPSQSGGANWPSSAYHPGTKLFYFTLLESCALFKKVPEPWDPSRRFFNGTTSPAPGFTNRRFVRALNIQTGEKVWDFPVSLGGLGGSGVLATAGGLVFHGDASGAFLALDARSGKHLWHFDSNQTWTSQPMTYMVAGKQYVAIANATGYFSFALPD